ncbi:MAG: polyhydroxyalkanoate synthesis regulator DNA-binding domain-containing protein [Legionellaceae bacterium]|nr:polyhydroxyalkanoate synthesis regulator DNA-binding domain-containing protein [Legionellaceae bacterium]
MVSLKPRLIKKYKNRRLYDLEMSQYITIDDLQRYVIEGIVFQVVDSTSNKDITSMTLLQIFVEMEANTLPFLSCDMLRQLIVLSHHPMNKSCKSMLENMMLMMTGQLQQNAYLNQPIDAWNKQTELFMSEWKAMFKG